MTDRNGVGWTNGTGVLGVEPGVGADENPSNDDLARSEFQLWRVYDAGGPVLILKVRYRDGVAVPEWRDGPDVATALRQAAGQGWRAYDCEPGAASGEHSIIHLKRIMAR